MLKTPPSSWQYFSADAWTDWLGTCHQVLSLWYISCHYFSADLIVDCKKKKRLLLFTFSLFMYTFFCALIALHCQYTASIITEVHQSIQMDHIHADDAFLPDDRNVCLLHLRWTWSTSYRELAGCTSQKNVHIVPFFTRLEDGNILFVTVYSFDTQICHVQYITPSQPSVYTCYFHVHYGICHFL